jgi:hypothetical protein
MALISPVVLNRFDREQSPLFIEVDRIVGVFLFHRHRLIEFKDNFVSVYFIFKINRIAKDF